MGVVIVPVIVWAAHFTLAYGFTAFACARHMAAAVPWVVGAVSVLALLVLIILTVRAARTPQLPDSLALGLGGLAAIAVVWEASALFWVPACV